MLFPSQMRTIGIHEKLHLQVENQYADNSNSHNDDDVNNDFSFSLSDYVI